MRQLQIGQVSVPYSIEWSGERSTIGLSMDEFMELTIRAPLSASEEDVEAAIGSRKDWILRTLYGIEEESDAPLDKEFVSGEKLPFNGRRYRLKTSIADVGKPILEFDQGRFELQVPEGLSGCKRQDQINEVVRAWYIDQAEEHFEPRVASFARKLGVKTPRIAVDELPGRWGECNNEEVVLHWRLVLAPTVIQDYVIAHELTHLLHEDHSKQFWNSLGAVIPDYESRREWLRVHGRTVNI